jgi:hypothetical protein
VILARLDEQPASRPRQHRDALAETQLVHELALRIGLRAHVRESDADARDGDPQDQRAPSGDARL